MSGSPIRPTSARATAIACVALLVCCCAGVRAARADAPASPDTALGGYLNALADSSDARFGSVAAPVDTVGLDSARVYAFAHPNRWRYKRTHGLAFFPLADFNRVDGAAVGAGATFGAVEERGRLMGQWAEALGPDPNLALGTGSFVKQLDRGASRWVLKLAGGRTTTVMDRETQGHELEALAAFISGGDRSHFLRQDGASVRLSREGAVHRIAAGYRDELESPRVTTATWNLRSKPLAVVPNLAATFGRARELDYELLWKLPRTPITAQVLHATSSRKIGSDFEYRRTLASAAADIGFARMFAIVPQVEYGALNGDALPQASFYLGGSHTLRSMPYAAAGGSRMAFGRLELIMVRDVFEVAHIPHPAAFPLQVAAFAGSGAVWGRDPYTGLVRPGVDWPDAADWRSEAGLSVMWQPGIPDPTVYTRINWAVPIGAGGGDARFTISVGRGLDLVKRFERE